MKIIQHLTSVFLFIALTTQLITAQTIVINEFCPSNLYLTDEDKDTPDWIELYNNSNAAVNLTGWYLSDKMSQPQMWAFPDINLQANGYLLVFASGKDRKAVSEYYPLVHYSEEFAYAIPNAQTATSWKNNDFDDSAWSRGQGGFGFGDNDDVTEVPTGTISIYIRKQFNIENLNSISQILFDVDFDDGFVAYINGHEIARTNMGDIGSTVTFDQIATATVEPLMINGSDPLRFTLTDFTSYMNEGINTLAIEIHNFSTASSDLTLIPFLTANSTQPGSGTVDPVLKLSNGKLHTNFKISSEGEAIYLSSPENTIVHQTDTLTVPSSASRGLKPDGTGGWYFFAEPTPGTANTTTGYLTAGAAPVEFSPLGGLFTTKTPVTLTTKINGTIYYTADGSVPKASSTKYTQPIQVSNSKVIRAIVISPDIMPGQPATQSYIFPQHTTTLPIVSLTSDPYNLFDYDYGIYADGPGYTNENPHFGANYWMDWERPINIEYFLPDEGKVFESPGGVKIFGAWSRANPQKSMALSADKSYGNKDFDYKFFNSKNIKSFKSLVLRNSGNDWSSAVLRDAVMTGLVRNVNVDIQAYQPAVVYLNGEYWGILDLREKMNEDYIENNFHGVKADSVDILSNDREVLEGTADHYNAMMSFITSNAMSKEDNYNKVKTMMEMDEYIEYMVAQIYFNNQDWPGNNLKYWRPQTETGKWRWMLYDTDFGFNMYGGSEYTENTLSFALEPNGTGWPNPAWSTLLLRKLTQSPVFVGEFANRFADRLNYEFEADNVLLFIDSLADNIRTEMPYHIDRWQHIWDWDGNVEEMRTFGENRQTYAFSFVNSQFNLGGTKSLTIQNSNKQAGYVQVNSLSIKDFPWTGKYFSKLPITVTAVARPGYRFVKWDTDLGSKQQIQLTVTANMTIKAIFEPVSMDYNSIVINEINYKSADNFNTNDWIELFNTTSGSIDLSGWTLNDAEGSKPFTFPAGTRIGPKGFLVVCEDKSSFVKYWPDVTPIVGEFLFGLGVTDEAIRLFDADHYLIDSLTYSSSDPWDDGADGKGPTLSLIDPYKNNDVAYRWEASKAHGTPGAQNDNYNTIPENDIISQLTAYCYPNPFNNQTSVIWEQPSDEMVNIKLINFEGKLLANLESKWYPKGKFNLPIGSISSELTPGFYFVKIKAGNNQNVLKLIKQ